MVAVNKPGEKRKKNGSIFDLSRFIVKQINVKFAGGLKCRRLKLFNSKTHRRES